MLRQPAGQRPVPTSVRHAYIADTPTQKPKVMVEIDQSVGGRTVEDLSGRIVRIAPGSISLVP